MSAGYQLNNPRGFAQQVVDLGTADAEKIGVVGLWSGCGYIVDYYAAGVCNEEFMDLLGTVVDQMPDEDKKALVLTEEMAEEWVKDDESQDPIYCDELVYVDPKQYVRSENLGFAFFSPEEFAKATQIWGLTDGNYYRKETA